MGPAVGQKEACSCNGNPVSCGTCETENPTNPPTGNNATTTPPTGSNSPTDLCADFAKACPDSCSMTTCQPSEPSIGQEELCTCNASPVSCNTCEAENPNNGNIDSPTDVCADFTKACDGSCSMTTCQPSEPSIGQGEF